MEDPLNYRDWGLQGAGPIARIRNIRQGREFDSPCVHEELHLCWGKEDWCAGLSQRRVTAVMYVEGIETEWWGGMHGTRKKQDKLPNLRLAV